MRWSPLLAALLAALLTALLTGVARAADQGRFATSNPNPFIQVYNLPSETEGPAAAGRWRWQFAATLANNSVSQASSSGELVVLDGESLVSRLSLAYGFSERLSLGATLPWVVHSGGRLDGFIRDWHQLLGLSDRKREELPDGALDFSYSGSAQFALQRATRGPGDLRLSAEWRLRAPDAARPGLQVRGGLKLPTGSSSALRGSGSTDLSLQFLSTNHRLLSAWDSSLSWMVGGLRLGRGGLLDELRREIVGIASVALSRPLPGHWQGRIQLDGHTPFYDTRLTALGGGSIQLAIGGSLRLEQGGRLDVAMTQNLLTDATPDFGLHLGWRRDY